MDMKEKNGRYAERYAKQNLLSWSLTAPKNHGMRATNNLYTREAQKKSTNEFKQEEVMVKKQQQKTNKITSLIGFEV